MANPDFPFVIIADSSSLNGYQYFPETEELLIKFKPKGVYVYRDVPLEVFWEFNAAESKGSFLSKNIKGVYQFEKVG